MFRIISDILTWLCVYQNIFADSDILLYILTYIFCHGSAYIRIYSDMALYKVHRALFNVNEALF